MLQGCYCCDVGSAGASTKHSLVVLIYSWPIVAFWELSVYVRAKVFQEGFGCILMCIFLYKDRNQRHHSFLLLLETPLHSPYVCWFYTEMTDVDFFSLLIGINICVTSA